jgi:hypothetical protein
MMPPAAGASQVPMRYVSRRDTSRLVKLGRGASDATSLWLTHPRIVVLDGATGSLTSAKWALAVGGGAARTERSTPPEPTYPGFTSGFYALIAARSRGPRRLSTSAVQPR